jgi:hypothetical protein
MTPDLAKPPPEQARRPYRFLISGTLPAYSKPDCTQQATRALERIGAKVSGASASEHLGGGIRA